MAMLLVMLLRLPAAAAARHTELKFQPLPELQVRVTGALCWITGWLCI